MCQERSKFKVYRNVSYSFHLFPIAECLSHGLLFHLFLKPLCGKASAPQNPFEKDGFASQHDHSENLQGIFKKSTTVGMSMDAFKIALVASLPLLAVGTIFKRPATELAVAFSSVLLSTVLAYRFLSPAGSSEQPARPGKAASKSSSSSSEKAPAQERVKEAHDYEFDVIVIGGGSGGLTCAKECAAQGAKAAVCDFVTPSPAGTTWGLGGTCVNVGCIPKKLMHQAALLGEGWRHQAEHFGWKVQQSEHNWDTLVANVQQHILNLNKAYEDQLKSKQVTYFNALAAFQDAHTLLLTDSKGNKSTVTANKFVVAVGGRPTYPEIPGAKELGISSDDLFSLKATPGQQVVVVGASYVALECAGFLAGLGCDVTVVVRSILLRGFDQDMAERLGGQLESMGVKLMRGYEPVSVIETRSASLRKAKSSRLQVTVRPSGRAPVGPGMADSEAKEILLPCSTVLFAIGRYALTDRLNLPAVGVLVDKNLKIPVRAEQSNVSHVYAIGDCAAPAELRGNAPELTPLAIKVGKLLARRLFGPAAVAAESGMDWRCIATTVFTPLEYGTVGLTEEDAYEQYGKEDVKVYRKSFVPLEHALLPKYLRPGTKTETEGDASKKPDPFHCKLVCGPYGKALGFHYSGPNAGEVTQGFALAMKLGATKQDFDMNTPNFCRAMDLVACGARGACAGRRRLYHLRLSLLAEAHIRKSTSRDERTDREINFVSFSNQSVFHRRDRSGVKSVMKSKLQRSRVRSVMKSKLSRFFFDRSHSEKLCPVTVSLDYAVRSVKL
eukprot:g2886.t1